MPSWFRPPSPDSEAARNYLTATPKKFRKKTPLAEVRFVVIDAETSGFDARKDRLLSIAALPLDKNSIVVDQLKSWLIYQPDAAVNDAVLVHGILPSETASGSPEISVMEELLPILSGAVLVGHYAGFDASMLDAALKRHFGIRLRNRFVDTAQLAMSGIEAFVRTGYANQRPPSLEEVCAKCGIEMMERHTAVGDTFTTAELFLLLCARLRKRLGRNLVIGDLQTAHL